MLVHYLFICLALFPNYCFVSHIFIIIQFPLHSFQHCWYPTSMFYSLKNLLFRSCISYVILTFVPMLIITLLAQMYFPFSKTTILHHLVILYLSPPLLLSLCFSVHSLLKCLGFHSKLYFLRFIAYRDYNTVYLMMLNK